MTARDDATHPTERAAAFERLVAQFTGMVHSVAVGFLGDGMAADDVVQETFLAAWQHLPKLREPERFAGWIRRIALWECHYVKRRERSDVDIEPLIEQLGDGTDLHGDAERAELATQIREVLWALPRPHREILSLHYLEHYGQQELAALLEIKDGAVRKRLHDARLRTRGLYERWSKHGLTSTRPPTAPTLWRKMMTHTTPDADGRTPQQRIDAMHKPKTCVATEEGRLVWDLFGAAIRDDVDTIRSHLTAHPGCARLQFWYVSPIHFAVREGNLGATRLLWGAWPTDDVTNLIQMADDRGHDAVAAYLRDAIGAAAVDSDLRLHEAVEAGDAEQITRLLADEPDLAVQRSSRRARLDPEGRSALHLAVLAGRDDLVRALLDGGVPVDVADHAGFRPAHCAMWHNGYWAAAKGGVDMLQRLLDGGAADSPALAAARGDITALQAFVEADAAAVNEGEALQKRPLSAAVEFGHREIVRWLLDHGADPVLPEGQMCRHGSALMAATVQDDVEVARWLVEAGADPNGGIDSSGTPAIRATSDAMRGLLYGYGGLPGNAWGYVQRGEFETVAAILRYCDDPFTDEAAEYVSNPWTAVISGRARVTSKGGDPTPFDAMFDMFLQRDLPLPTVLTECKTYLYRVPSMTRRLLDKGLDPNLPDWLGRTPLHDICVRFSQSVELAEMFLEHGADIDAIDEQDRSTPLGIAAREGAEDMVKLLLERGANRQAAGAAWATPIAWAARRGHNSIVELLQA